MPRLSHQPAFALLLLTLVSCVGGCATLQLPRIDPTGQNIFLSSPNYTTTAPLNNEFLGGLRPAYQQPPSPPPCEPPPAVAADNVALAQPPANDCPPLLDCGPAHGCGALLDCEPECPPLYCQPSLPVQTVSSTPSSRVVLRPSRMIAPVGTEVVLLGGLCGPDGFLRTGERIDWLLSQDSVGNFVDVGPPDDTLLAALHRHKQPGKVGSNLAVGKTGSVAQVLTRGTPAVEDDVQIQAGQTWISVTSAVEGVSHVTAYAPAAKDWNGRQQSAAIHWIDAQWVLPPPAIGRSGVQQTLVTTVTRATQAVAVAGWIVRYQVLDGPPINFVIDGVQRPEQAVEVFTDANGQAAITVTPQTQQPGVTQIAIEIVRPGSSPGDLNRLSVGQGGTSITWSAAGLTLNTTGPDVAQQGSTLVYTIDVANPGDLGATEVVVSNEIPAGFTYLRSTPAAQVFGNRLEWRIGSLGPAQNTRLQIEYRADREMQVRNCATARSAEGVAAESCATTTISNPGFSLRTEGPAQAEVGSRVTFRIVVTNVTDQTLREVKLLDQYDAGLSHPERVNPIERKLGDLGARQTVDNLSITFTVTQPGRHCHRLRVTSVDGRQAEASACVVGVQPAAAPSMQVRCSGPAEANVNERIWMSVDITNTGQTPLTEIQIVDRYDASLKAERATPGFTPTPGQLVWQVPQLQPGETIQRQVEILCQAPDQQACNRVTVMSRQLPAQTDQSCIVIYSRPGATAPPLKQPAAPGSQFPPARDPAQPPVGQPQPPATGVRPANPPPLATPGAPASGQLLLKVSDSGDPVRVGAGVTYLISVTNDRDVSDRQVNVVLHLPPQLQMQQLSGPVTQYSATTDGRVISIVPITELRPREAVHFRVQMRAGAVGLAALRVSVQSVRTTPAVEVTEQTKIDR